MKTETGLIEITGTRFSCVQSLPEVLLKQIGKDEYRIETPGGIVKFGEGTPGPMMTTAAALAGCLAMSVSETLEVMRQKVHGIKMRMSYERKKEEPKIFDQFNIHLIIRGESLSSTKIEKAVHLAEEKTCPMSVMMRHVGAEMKTTFAIEETAPTLKVA